MNKEAINILKVYTDGKQNTEKVEVSVMQLNRVIKALEQEPQQRTGRWVSYPHQKDRECSICGHSEPYKFADKEAKIFNYCPYCGCAMKGESE